MVDERPAVSERRARQREALVSAAERRIAARGLEGLKAREIAAEVGIALGAIYNLVEDMDEVVLRVASRTLRRLDRALDAAAGDAVPPGDRAAIEERLVAIADAYLDFAVANPRLWGALFEHRLPPGKPTPDWSLEDQRRPLRHVTAPLTAMLPDLADPDRDATARMLFSAAHGVVMLGLDSRLAEETTASVREQLALLVRALCRGLVGPARA